MEHKQKILIVDDKVENLITLEKVLQEIKVEIIRAENGNEALKATLNHDFALAILDVQMPEMDGYELAEYLRNEEKTKHLPMIFLSAVFSDEYHVFKGYEAGAVDFVTKPYNPYYLISKVKIFLQLEEQKKELQEKLELEISKNYLESILMSVNDSIIVLSLDGIMKTVNKATLSLWEYKHKEMIDSNIGKLFENDIYSNWLNSLKNYDVSQNKANFSFKKIEVNLVTKNKLKIPALISGSALLDREGSIQGAVLVAVDISGRKQKEEELKASNQQLTASEQQLKASNQQLLDQTQELSRMVTVVKDSNDAVLIHDLEGNITAWNAGATKTYGYSEREAFKMNVSDLVPEEYKAEALNFIASLKKGELIESLETKRETKDGKILDVWIVVTKLVDKDGKLIGAATTERDITERKQAEDELKASNQQLLEQTQELSRMATVVIDSNDAITIHDLEGNITAWNAGAIKMYGYSEQEAFKMNVSDLVPEEYKAEALDFMVQLQKGELIESLETKRKTKDGKILDVWMVVTKLVDKDGKLIGAATTERDITERKQAEEDLKKYREHLEELVKERTVKLEKSQQSLALLLADVNESRAELDISNIKLATSNKELEAFSYSVSHDLRAPLRAIDGFTRILLQDYVDKLDDEGKRLGTVIRKNSQKMGKLIDDLLAFSRLGRASMNFSRIDMKNMAKAIYHEATNPDERKRINFSTADLPDANGDPNMFRQVWLNLISNAIKFSSNRPQTVISVTCREEEDKLNYCISDNGAGFDMKYKDKLFGVFQRLHNERDFPGTGVGLALVQRIIHRHNGKVWAEGEVDKGASFYFSLPKKKAEMKYVK